MRKHKYMLAQFTFYDRTGIQKLLEKRAKEGWLLEKISNFFWIFRRIDPRPIHYAVTYFPKASQFDPHPGEEQQELLDFCAHSGWVLAGTTAQLQIFYNEQENPVPIETDPVIELQNIHKSAKKSFLPAYGMLFVLSIMQIALQVGHIRKFPLTYLSRESTIFNLFCQLILILLLGVELAGYLLWYPRARKAAANGEFLETRGHRKFQMFLLWCLVFALLLLLGTMSPRLGATFLLCLVCVFGLYAIIFGVQGFLKRRGAPTGVTRIVTIVLAFVLAFGITFGVGNAAVKVMSAPIWEENQPAATVEAYGMTFDIYKDEIPLKIEHLADISSPDYSYTSDVQRTFLLRREECAQRIWGPSDLPDLEYVIYTARIPAIYDLCVRESISSSLRDWAAYEQTDAAPWGARQVYQRYLDGEPSRRYVLCYENKVIVFSPGWELTVEQMALVGDILGK